MIAELAPIEETQLGKDLIEQGALDERRLVAQNLKNSGMNVAQIAKAMKRTEEEIKALGIND